MARPMSAMRSALPGAARTVSLSLFLKPHSYVLTPISPRPRWYSEQTPSPQSQHSQSEKLEPPPSSSSSESSQSDRSSTSSSNSSTTISSKSSHKGKFNLYGDEWEDTVDFQIQSFDDLPHRLFGVNQHMIINYELKEALRLMLRQFNAPIVYCFAYGSGVFAQENSGRSVTEAEFRAVHPKPSRPSSSHNEAPRK